MQFQAMVDKDFKRNVNSNRNETDKINSIRVFTIYGRGGHLGHVTSIMLINFHFLVPESFHTNFGSEWLSSF